MTAESASFSRRTAWQTDGVKVGLLQGHDERRQWESSLHQAGLRLPLPHRSAWAAVRPAARDLFLTVADSTGRPCGALALQVAPSRVLPGYLIVRCQRFGPGISRGAQRAALNALVDFARTERRVLRLHVETYSIYLPERTALEGHMRDLGFEQVQPGRCYEHTLLMSLENSVDMLFQSLHSTARKNIRAAAKRPVRVQPIDDPSHFARLDELSHETYARTGGRYDGQDWSQVVELGRREPTGSRLVGLYRTDIPGPAGLLAFAWARGHGDTVEYSRAGSTRATDLRTPLIYPVMWDLIQWAKASGARFFDFGGVTIGKRGSDDPLGSISDFKRYFSERVVTVGAEWSFEPRPLQAYAAKVMSTAAGFLARAWTRAHRPANPPRISPVAGA